MSEKKLSDPAIRSLRQNAKISGHYIVSCRKHIKELKKEIEEKRKLIKSEQARGKRLEKRKVAFEKAADWLEAGWRGKSNK